MENLHSPFLPVGEALPRAWYGPVQIIPASERKPLTDEQAAFHAAMADRLAALAETDE
jgi:hypothetical protein